MRRRGGRGVSRVRQKRCREFDSGGDAFVHASQAIDFTYNTVWHRSCIGFPVPDIRATGAHRKPT